MFIVLFFQLFILSFVDARCGTTKKDLSCLAVFLCFYFFKKKKKSLISKQVSTDFHAPIHSKCHANVCDSGKLPWDIYFNFCRAVETPAANCVGSVACQKWDPAAMETASLGAVTQATFTDGPGPDQVTYAALGGTKAMPVGGITPIPRSFSIVITCPKDGEPSQPYPVCLISFGLFVDSGMPILLN